MRLGELLDDSDVERKGASLWNIGLSELSIPLEYNDSESEEQEALRLVAYSYQGVPRLHSLARPLATPPSLGLGIGDRILDSSRELE